MSTVSATSRPQPYAPLRPQSEGARLAAAIGRELSAGSLSATDATALTGALRNIDTSLSAEAAGTTGEGRRLDPAAMKTRIDGLIDRQVTSGGLTSGQADALKGLFAQQAGGPPPDGGAEAASGPEASAGAAQTGAGDSDTEASDLLASFLQLVQASQANSAGYGAGGSGRAGPTVAALLFDFES